MAETNPCGWLQNVGATHTANQLRMYEGAMLSGLFSSGAIGRTMGGVQPALGTALAVVANGTPNMTVIVGAGLAFVPGSEFSTQGVYYCHNDANVTLTISTAPGTGQNRIDLVVAKVQDQFYSGAANTWSLAVVTGVAAASPTAPTAPNNSVILAQVFVGANVTSITNANITDVRPFASALGGVIPCTSTQRPGTTATLALIESQLAWENDTNTLIAYDGTNWLAVSSSGAGSLNAQAVTSGTDTTTSATYVNMAGTGSVTTFSFTKRTANTRVKLEMNAGFTNAVGTSLVDFALQIGGTDYQMGHTIQLVVTATQQFSGVRIVSGIPAGVYTVQCRWRREGGSGTPTRGSNEWLSASAEEIR